MSPIRLESVTAPAGVEKELAALLANASQNNLAEACGLTNHARISKGFALVTGGQVDGYSEAFSAAKVLRWAKAYAPLAAAVHSYLNGAEETHGNVVEELREEINADAEMIAKINKSLTDGILTRTARARLALDLRKAIDRQARLIKDLEAK